MPNLEIDDLNAVASGTNLQEFAINEAGTSKKLNMSQVAQFVNLSGIVISLPSDAAANGNTTAVRVSGMDVFSVSAGNYVFEYYVRAVIADGANTIKFAVNHTGTTTSFVYDFFYTNTGTAQTTGVIDQELNATTGQCFAVQATRVKNTLLGPETSCDTSGGEYMFFISGMMVVTVAGTLQLYQGSEIAGNLITIKKGTSLLLTKTG